MERNSEMSVKSGVGVSCNSRAQGIEAERSEVQGHPHLQSQKKSQPDVHKTYQERKEGTPSLPIKEEEEEKKEEEEMLMRLHIQGVFPY